MLMAQGYVVGVVLGLRRSVRGIFLSVRDGGVCSKIQRGSAEGRRRRKKKKKRKNKVKNRSEGRGKCINDLVAAGLTGLHGHGWRMVTVLPHAPKVWVTSLCLAVKYVDAQKFCAMLLRRYPEGVDMWHENMMLLPVSSQKQKENPLPSAVDKCRYVRTINLLPGVARISDKRGRGASNAGGEREQ